MATLIQSKQIEGIVTASVINGVFIISGSQILTGSLFVDGDITASNIVEASQFVGDGSRLTGVVATGTGISFETGSTLSTITKMEISGSGVHVDILNSNTASITIDYTDLSSLNAFTESYFVDSSSIDTRLEDLEASVGGGGTGIGARVEALETSSATFATTGSNSFIGNQNISGDVTITGRITAQEFHTELISSSVIYESGSTKFGDSADDVHQITGSLRVSGSLYLNGSNFSASVQSNLTNLSSSVATSLSGSSYTQNIFSQSVDSRLDSVEASLGGGGSIGTRVNALEIFSASQEIKDNTLGIYTASVDDKISQLITDSGSQNVRITALETFSSSLDSSFATDIELAAVSASISASQTYISSSISNSLSALSQSSGFINYVTNSIEHLTGIEVADFDNNTAVTFTNGVLKFIFGTPTAPTSVAASLSGFATDRFNRINDTYTINGSWNNQGYTLVSASLYEGSTLLTQVGSGTSLTYSTTTSGSHTYQLQYTASSPLDGTLYTTSTTTTGTVSKTNPASPTLTPSATIQLGVTSNQMEQGATGSITFTSSSANPSNSWNLTSVTTNVSSPYYVTGSVTGSSSISITATANYASPTGDNSPDLTTTSTATTTYTKIRSLRYGASSATSFTAPELENLALWDTTLGGTIGTIVKGTTTASGQSVTISWTGDKYHYIVFNSSLSNLSNITTSGFGVLGQFGVTTVGQYKVYKTSTLQAGGAGSSITYVLT